MGGYGSGRTRKHTPVWDCVSIDTTLLRKHKMLTGKLKQGGDITFTNETTDAKCNVTVKKHALYCRVERYPDGAAEGKFHGWDAEGHITLVYGVMREDQQMTHREDIPLVTTTPEYGGARWWFLAPCCGRRCRVVYLPLSGDVGRCIPQCRVCLDLHYASQLQSSRDRHISYEKHLLRNYGYYWAMDAYHQLKEHYLKIDDSWRYIMAKSEFDRELEVMKHLIKSQRLMMRMDITALKTIKSQEDRVVYLEHLAVQHGPSYIIELAHMLGISHSEEAVTSMPERDFEEAFLQAAEDDAPIGDKDKDILSLYQMVQRKRETEEQLQLLRQRKAS